MEGEFPARLTFEELAEQIQDLVTNLTGRVSQEEWADYATYLEDVAADIRHLLSLEVQL